MLKSERVLNSESIEATPINHATCEHIHARGLAWCNYVRSSYDRSDEAVEADILATRLFKQRVPICE